MQVTNLPNKADWARQIDDVRKANKITKRDLSAESDISHVTLNKVIAGDAYYETMKEVENALRKMINVEYS